MESNSNFSNLSFSQGTVSNDEVDPRILATFYTTFKIGDALKQFYYPILVPVGIVGNVLSFLVMMQPQNRQMSFSLNISALAVSDTIAILTVLVTYLHEVHGVYMPPNEHWFCSIQVFMFYSSYMCSTHLMITMTFERFFSITRPLNAASFNTINRARIMIVLIFLFGFTYSIPFLFIGANHGRTCIPNAIVSSNLFGEIYYYLTEIVTSLIPFVSLLIMNSVIINTLRKRSKTSISDSIGQGQTQGQNVKIKQSEKQVYTMLLVLTFVFLALSLPVTLLIFYVNFYTGNTPYYFASLHLFYQFGEKTHATNHGINFFLYVISGQKFGKDLKKLICAKIVRNNESVPSRVNTKRTSTAGLNNQVRP